MVYPLAGIRIIEFAWVGVGPMAGRYLADYGAEVIKVESWAAPDRLRRASPSKDNTTGENRSAYFANLNSSKYDVILNLKHPKSRDIALRLVSLADVVTESFTPGTMKRWDLAYEDLQQAKPDTILVSMSMMGQTGPHSQYKGYGNMLQALAGINHLMGWPDRDPVGPCVAYTDWFVPPLAATAIIAALEYRERTGQGQHIDISQFETSAHTLESAVLEYTANGRIPARAGNRHPRAAPHGVYRCQGEDRWVAIAVFTEEEWQAFCLVLGNPTWTRDDMFNTLEGRLRHAVDLDRLVEGWTCQYPPEKVMTAMQAAGVAAGVVQNGKDVHHDPQLAHRQHFIFLDHPEMGRCAYDSPPFRLSKAPGQPRMPAPLLGQHTQEIYTGLLGLSDAELASLAEEGVLS